MQAFLGSEQGERWPDPEYAQVRVPSLNPCQRQRNASLPNSIELKELVIITLSGQECLCDSTKYTALHYAIGGGQAERRRNDRPPPSVSRSMCLEALPLRHLRNVMPLTCGQQVNSYVTAARQALTFSRSVSVRFVPQNW